MRADVALGLVDSRALHASIYQRPGNIPSDAEHIGVVTICCAFINERGVRLPTSVLLLLAYQPVAGPLDQPRIHFRHLCHVVELHQAVGGKYLVSGSLAEPREPASRDFEGKQTLV